MKQIVTLVLVLLSFIAKAQDIKFYSQIMGKTRKVVQPYVLKTYGWKFYAKRAGKPFKDDAGRLLRDGTRYIYKSADGKTTYQLEYGVGGLLTSLQAVIPFPLQGLSEDEVPSYYQTMVSLLQKTKNVKVLKRVEMEGERVTFLEVSNPKVIPDAKNSLILMATYNDGSGDYGVMIQYMYGKAYVSAMRSRL